MKTMMPIGLMIKSILASVIMFCIGVAVGVMFVMFDWWTEGGYDECDNDD